MPCTLLWMDEGVALFVGTLLKHRTLCNWMTSISGPRVAAKKYISEFFSCFEFNSQFKIISLTFILA